MPLLTTKDVRIQGFPALDVLLSHFNALPILVQACRDNPEALAAWDAARNVAGPTRQLHPVTQKGVAALEADEESHG